MLFKYITFMPKATGLSIVITRLAHTATNLK
jgi:hypothetical protein